MAYVGVQSQALRRAKVLKRCRASVLQVNDQASVGLYLCLCHQRWKSRPGLVAARTVVLTDTTAFLCQEDHGGLGRGAPRMRIVDQAPLLEVAAVEAEAVPEQVTILVRRPLKRKRWRLLLGHRANAERLILEVRRRIGAEDEDLDDDDLTTRGSLYDRGSLFSDSIRASLPRAPSLFGRSKA